MILFIKTTKPCSTRINKYTSTLKGLLFCGFSLKQKQFTPLILAPPITGYNSNRSVNQTETEFKSSNIYWVLLPTGDVFAFIIGVSANSLWPFCLLFHFYFMQKDLCQFSVPVGDINLLECQNLIKMQNLMHSVYITVTKSIYLS